MLHSYQNAHGARFPHLVKWTQMELGELLCSFDGVVSSVSHQHDIIIRPIDVLEVHLGIPKSLYNHIQHSQLLKIWDSLQIT